MTKYNFSFRILVLFFLVISVPMLSQKKSEKPNIVWIVCEDISPYIGSYEYQGVQTPNIDSLARQGVKYTKAYTAAGVCAPSRSSIITGMYPTSIGTQHMRTLRETGATNNSPVQEYSAVIPSYVKCFPEYLRQEGYYCSNNEKQDYQFVAPVTVWDENSAAASWRNREGNQPFFSVFNLAITHELNLFIREKEALSVDPKQVVIPEYYPKTETAARAIARQLTNIEIMDKQVGEIIKMLKEDGLYDSTWVIFYSDHGGALPLMKREILERGIHIPFIVKYPKNQNSGTINSDLISGVDFAPSMLSLAGIKVPRYMQGQSFLGKQKNKKARKYIFAARDRMDLEYDRVRAVSDGKYKYIYNYMLELPYYQDIGFRNAIPIMKEILTLKESGQLNSETMKWFDKKPLEELYDIENDPNEFKNLIEDSRFTAKLKELRAAYTTWKTNTGDQSAVSEKEMINNWWNGQPTAPNTAQPVIIPVKNGYRIRCDTEGASIGYQIIKKDNRVSNLSHTIASWDFSSILGKVAKNGEFFESDKPWIIYNNSKPIKLDKGDSLIVKALRIGFKEATLSYIEK